METYRYRRSHLPCHSLDNFNAFASEPASRPLEYWTNGRTTFVMANSSVEENISSKDNSSLAKRLTRYITRPLPANKDQHVVRNSILAGSLSGIVSTLTMFPLDVLRTKMQAETVVEGNVHRSPFQVFRHTIEHGGVRALYTGLTLPLAAQALYKGTVFTMNNVCQTLILDWKTLENHKMGILEEGQLTMSDRFWCGVMGGAVNAALFVTPVEFVRNQLIAQHSKLASGKQVARLASGSLDVIRHSIREHGFFSLWRGTGLSVTRDAVGCGCFFLTMGWTQRHFTPPGESPSFPVTVFSGACSGLAFWLSCLPIDTVKTWIQSADLTVSISARDSIQRIYRESGYTGLLQELFRGWQVAYGRGVPAAAITISVYSMTYQYLQTV